MFWETPLVAASEINVILEEPDVTLEKVLDQSNVLDDCKIGNAKLISFLTASDKLSQLINLVTIEPPPCENEKLRYKFANMACEILICENSEIPSNLVRKEHYGDLFEFLNSDVELNPLLASFVCKIIYKLWIYCSERISDCQKYNLFERIENFTDMLIKHMETSAIVDLLSITSLTTREDLRMDEFYYRQRLIPKLIELFKKGSNPAARSNAAYFLCEYVRNTRDQVNWSTVENLLCQGIESTSTLTTLLEYMFEDKSEGCLVDGMQVLQSLLEYEQYRLKTLLKRDECQENENTDGISARFRTPTHIGNILIGGNSPLARQKLAKIALQVHAAVEPRLADFHSLLLNPPTKDPIRTVIGVIEKPFGATRIEVVHLIKALLSSNNPRINEKLKQLQTIPLLIDLFFQYPHNNFLHSQVEQSIKSIINNSELSAPLTTPTDDDQKLSDQDRLGLLHQLLQESKLMDKILENCSQYLPTTESPHPRPSYVGHLVWIANHIANGTYKLMFDMGIVPEIWEKWNDFIQGPLKAENLLINTKLVSETAESESHGDPTEEKLFVEYQLQRMTRELDTDLGWDATAIAAPRPNENTCSQDNYMSDNKFFSLEEKDFLYCPDNGDGNNGPQVSEYEANIDHVKKENES